MCDVGRESVTLQISKDTSIAWYDDNVTIAHSIELHNLVYTFCSNKINNYSMRSTCAIVFLYRIIELVLAVSYSSIFVAIL